jgi:hypothetical protein
VWSLARDLRVRPSAVLAITDGFVAFCVDRALWVFSSCIEQDQEEATRRLPENAKPQAHQKAKQRVLDRYLGTDSMAKFRSPIG